MNKSDYISMKYIKRILGVTAAMLTAVTIQAQTYNDSVRTNTWSIYAQGGLSTYSVVRSTLFDDSKKTIAPDLGIGVKYNIQPWVRIGLNVGYTMVKSTNRDLTSSTVETPNFIIGDYPGTLVTYTTNFQDRNNMHLLGADFNLDFNLLNMVLNRKHSQFNIWLGVGIGYIHGWNRNSTVDAVKEVAIAGGTPDDTYFNVYTHDYINSNVGNRSLNTMYVPIQLSAEYDLTPRWTAGVYGLYRDMLLDKELSPSSILSGGLLLRYNFVDKRVKSNKKLYYETLEKLNSALSELMKTDAQLEESEKNATELGEMLAKQKSNNKLLRDEVSNCIGDHIVYFNLNDTQLTEQEKIHLMEYIERVKLSEEYSLSLVGEASADGTPDANQKLSEGRLASVTDFLNANGISSANIQTKAAIGDSQQGFDPKYRRVTIHYNR